MKIPRGFLKKYADISSSHMDLYVSQLDGNIPFQNFTIFNIRSTESFLCVLDIGQRLLMVDNINTLETMECTRLMNSFYMLGCDELM